MRRVHMAEVPAWPGWCGSHQSLKIEGPKNSFRIAPLADLLFHGPDDLARGPRLNNSASFLNCQSSILGRNDAEHAVSLAVAPRGGAARRRRRSNRAPLQLSHLLKMGLQPVAAADGAITALTLNLRGGSIA